MRQVIRVLVLVAFLTGLASACERTPIPEAAPSSTGKQPTSPAWEVAKKFSPFFYMHPDEPYLPKEIGIMVDNADLRMKPSSVKIPRQPTVADLATMPDSEDLYLDLRAASQLTSTSGNPWEKEYKEVEEQYRTTVYAHVARTGSKTAVQYWLFYFFNDGINKHEGDWEIVQLLFDSVDWQHLQYDAIPVSIALSRHGKAATYQWGDITVVANHPPVYVAKGSHANYARPGNFVLTLPGIDVTENLDVTSLSGPVVAPPDPQLLAALRKTHEARVEEYQLVMLSDMAWLKFAGNWGEWYPEPLPAKAFSGPLGPAFQNLWRGTTVTPTPTPAPKPPSPTLSHPWPMFGHDPQHTGQSEYNGQETPALKWSYDAARDILSSPAIAADGTIYFGSRDNNLYAIDPDGSLKWTFDVGGDSSSPAIASDGTIYVGSSITDNNLYAINPDGSLKWQFTMGDDILSPPVVTSNGIIYVGSKDHHLYAINPDGSPKWRFEARDRIVSSPAIAEDGTVYAGDYDGWLYAINPDGSLKWAYDTAERQLISFPVSTPAVGADGTIYVSADHTELFAINPDGSLKWVYDKEGIKGISSPAIAADGTIYVVSGDNYLFSISSDGSLNWTARVGDLTPRSSPTITADGIIYVGCKDRNLYAINPDGSLKWIYKTDGDIESFLAIGADGVIYIGKRYGELYAIGKR